jgi:hypothetical protein
MPVVLDEHGDDTWPADQENADRYAQRVATFVRDSCTMR